MNRIAPDKWKHFFVGIVMGATLQICTWYIMPERYFISIVISFILVIVISYGFELFSLFTGRGHYEIMDAVAGIIGGAVGMVSILVFLHFFSFGI